MTNAEVPNANVGDMISRRAAIDAFDGAKVDEEYCDEYDIGYNDGINFAISKLSVLPSAQRKGKWCMTPDGQLVCSCCYSNPTNRIIIDGDLVYDMTPIRKHMKFCPNCGAEMVKGEEDGRSDQQTGGYC